MHAMGPTSGELRLPTVAVAVELARAGRAPERVELFVADTPRRGRSELASDVATLLEDVPPFLPVRELDAEGGPRVALVNKQGIAWVAIALAAVEADDDTTGGFALFDHDHEVRVELDVGVTLAGRVLYSSPADRSRLADHLNLPGDFVRLWATNTLYLVNKRHVVRVLEVA